LDEAHTFVQWGDDFRPSFHRVERFLGELRAAFGLPVTALTATANRVVHAGLREGVFGLDPSSPGNRDDGELVTVRENPIRPEIAIFRRTMGTASPATVDGIVEEVLDALDDHAIFYCLTVKEVIRLHAHLREYLGDAGRRILRFHGRLTEAEKSAVMTEFREAPRRGEEGFVPAVVVATSAFGLGINRPDIRTVFCVSPATDLAALYQQLGRAGRDAAARGGSGAAGQVSGPANTGLTLLTSRGLRTVAFMTGQDISAALLHRMAQAVLSCHGVLDTMAEAQRLIGQDLAGGRLTTHEAGQQRTVDAYATGLVRALAALADLGAVSDLGDFPPVVTLKPGELFSAGPAGADPADAGETAVVKRLLALPARHPDHRELQRTRLDVARADAWLAATVPGFRDLAADPPATWQLLADLHDRGRFDVSAGPSRRLVTGVAVHSAGIPAAFAAAVSGKAVRAAVEIGRLRDFFTDTKTCANVKFADYFEVAAPEVCCTTAENRCSTCWDFHTDWPPGEREPATGQALLTVRPRPAGWRVDAAARARRLDEQVRMLLWAVDRGLSSRDVHLALRGQDAWFFAREGRWIRLRPSVVSSRFFGANPSVTLAQVEDSLGRLAADGQAVAAGRRWREAGNVARQRRRLAASVAGGA
jgi:ATP-dependent DNA helicase RecQ